MTCCFAQEIEKFDGWLGRTAKSVVGDRSAGFVLGLVVQLNATHINQSVGSLFVRYFQKRGMILSGIL